MIREEAVIFVREPLNLVRAHFGRSVRVLDAPCGLWTLRAQFGRAVRALDTLRSQWDALRSVGDELRNAPGGGEPR